MDGPPRTLHTCEIPGLQFGHGEWVSAPGIGSPPVAGLALDSGRSPYGETSLLDRAVIPERGTLFLFPRGGGQILLPPSPARWIFYLLPLHSSPLVLFFLLLVTSAACEVSPIDPCPWVSRSRRATARLSVPSLLYFRHHLAISPSLYPYQFPLLFLSLSQPGRVHDGRVPGWKASRGRGRQL